MLDKLNSVQEVLQSQKLQLGKILERVTDVRLDDTQGVHCPCLNVFTSLLLFNTMIWLQYAKQHKSELVWVTLLPME